MTRYVAFLRGVSPMNCKMSELKRCLESAGFTNVRTVLASGNAVFDSRLKSSAEIERKAEAAMARHLGRSFATLVRPVPELTAMLDAEPHAKFKLPSHAKRIVSFLREARKEKLELPLELDGASILATDGREVFSAYTPSPRGPVFMALIEKTFGKQITTRTWDTVKKCAKA